MKRRTFDTLVASGGVIVAIVLVVAGAFLLWGHSFANSNVRHQLAQQDITFPAKGSQALASPQIGPYLNRYTGQQLLNGPQAKAYADHFIAVHVAEMTGGKTYAQVSAQAQAQPDNAQAQALANTVFKGETLRGLLLEAYGFWEMGRIALIAAICSFALAAAMLVLSGLGFLHLRRVAPDTEILAHHPGRTHPLPA
jgi:hypothetical protein